MVGELYRRRLDALEQTWQAWAELGRGLTEQQWSTPTRCPGWDVAGVYAHASLFPLHLSTSPPVPAAQPVGTPVTAVQLLRQSNTPTGMATTMAITIAGTVALRQRASSPWLKAAKQPPRSPWGSMTNWASEGSCGVSARTGETSSSGPIA